MPSMPLPRLSDPLECSLCSSSQRKSGSLPKPPTAICLLSGMMSQPSQLPPALFHAWLPAGVLGLQANCERPPELGVHDEGRFTPSRPQSLVFKLFQYLSFLRVQHHSYLHTTSIAYLPVNSFHLQPKVKPTRLAATPPTGIFSRLTQHKLELQQNDTEVDYRPSPATDLDYTAQTSHQPWLASKPKSAKDRKRGKVRLTSS